MERLQYHEFGHQLKLFKYQQGASASTDCQRKRREDQWRQNKISNCTRELVENEEFTVGDFLENLVSESIFPREGKNKFDYVRIHMKSYSNQSVDRKYTLPYPWIIMLKLKNVTDERPAKFS